MIEQVHTTHRDSEQHIPIESLQNISKYFQRLVLEETQGGRRIIRNLVSIMDGEDPDAGPYHRIQSARLLLQIGFEEARAVLTTPRAKSEQPGLSPSPSMGEGWDGGDPQHAADAANGQQAQQPLNPEHEKLNKKLVARIRTDSENGASIVRILIDIMEGHEPDAKARDRIEAAKVLLDWGFGNPAQPDPEFMMFYAPCHPDCLCVCKDLPEDHPEVVQSHAPLTEAQEKELERQVYYEQKAVESVERKVRADRAWQIEQRKLPNYKEYKEESEQNLREAREKRRAQRQRDQQRNRSP